ncbi:ATP synthase F1 subunit gamma [Mycoplasma tauri]|uniref:ATP synthase gamma chain n=1 Tax=Mycoplasma tauri TaxID=547987 RepID=A0A953ND09_9MOLU|nr:ATP synthase F1 subunit gamma [Mycoplasma tauri]MBZ4195606.1 F0F1 ATP synthase subunit gamma [Mycoplasma tauri]MBZ4203790.1 F0F1 ATP synthase subunit gamma [Mycoplasma tauri]MBZ4204449.1 F0F1 ATP synthase subunit gamma [Mycoplasma tauri]MBZ4212447.1 F0F1 ATP synthase subunit gamma [Mycoplasma tauri]MBZ4226921.1 F0F1 ATP synthase subunit gamma [Mycoplasma tauri]
MANIQSIKNRMNSVKSIRKITHAMELVSFSKLKKAKKDHEEITKYNSLIDETFQKIFENMYEDEINELIRSRSTTNTKLYVVITSNFGLAGSYNSNIIKLAKDCIKPEDKIIVIGSYGERVFNHLFKNQIVASYYATNLKEWHSLVHKIVKVAVKMYYKNEISSINVIYTKFINNLLQKETLDTIFPFDEKKIKEYVRNENIDHKLEFEPNPATILKEAIPLYIDAKLYLTISESQICEIASRRIAMESATDNADKLIDELDIEFKRKRQGKITNEIIEIVSGANAV